MPPCRERAGRAEKDRRIAAEHLFPDAPRRRQIPSLKRDALHALEDVIDSGLRRDDERFDRLAQKTRLATTSHAESF
jgi:hypothetical protein